MIISIKKVKQCRNGAYGNYLLRGRERADITISMKLNKTLAEYSYTLLHELMHLYITLLRKEGFKSTNKLEHKMIYDLEDTVVTIMRKYYENGKAKTY